VPDSVLVAFDGTPLSKRALRFALETFPDASLTSIYVIDPYTSILDVETGGLPVATEWYDVARKQASDVHATAVDIAAAHGVDLATATEVGGAAHEILEYAREHDIDHIVMGSHGREGIDRLVLGSVAETVTRRAETPVTILR